MEMTQEVLDGLNDNALYHIFGIRVEEAGQGRAFSRLVPNPDLCWPVPEQLHGGVLFTLMDTTMAWSVMSRLDPGDNCATTHLDIQYILPAKEGPFTCSARTTHQTGHMAFVRAEIRDARDRPLAMGQATFRIMKQRR